MARGDDLHLRPRQRLSFPPDRAPVPVCIDYLARSSASTQMSSSGKVRDFYIKEALNYIEQNFQNDISVEGIAAFCGLNRTYFGRIFKETVGSSPQQFLLNYRMTKAAELLKLTTLSVSDIGNAVGYPNQLHFSRAFKNVYGVSPREWRNKNHITRWKFVLVGEMPRQQ